MADQMTLDLIAEEVRRSPLLKRPMGFYKPPVSTTDAALSFLPQIEFQPCMHDGKIDLDLRVELFPMEQGSSDPTVEGLNPLFASYVNGGEFNFGTEGHGHVTYVRRDGGWWKPSRFTLQPLFDLNHVKSVEQGRRRIAHVVEKRGKRPPYLLLRWSVICEALETLELVGDNSNAPYAQLYQAVRNTHGEDELWVGSLPRLPDAAAPNRNGRLTIPKENESGHAIRLTAPFLSNLLYIAQGAGVVEDGLNFAKSYYVARQPDTKASLRKEIDELEFQLREKREQLEALEGD